MCDDPRVEINCQWRLHQNTAANCLGCILNDRDDFKENTQHQHGISEVAMSDRAARDSERGL